MRFLVSRQARELAGPLAAMAAIVAPALLASPSLPWSNFQANAIALFGWGLWLAWLARTPFAVGLPRSTGWQRVGLSAIFAAVAILVGAALVSWLALGWPGRILLRHLVALAAVALLVYVGSVQIAPATHRTTHPHPHPPKSSGWSFGTEPVVLILWMLVAAGSVNALIAWAQYVGATEWLPGLAPMGRDGRPGGHLRQPNLLGTQLIWAFVALVPLHAMGRCTWRRFLFLGALLVTGLALCGSRTALLSSLIVAAWGATDRRMSLRVRVVLVALPVALVLGWLMLWVAAQLGGQSFSGVQLLQKADLTSSRGRLWQQSLRLIQNDPWTGVGYGQFNFAWTLTPMDGLLRVGKHTFTHAHNLLVHWAVELGVPLTSVLLMLIVASVWAALRFNWRTPGTCSPAGRAATVMVIVVLLHSQLEFPLWQLNFLLPTAFLWGLAFASPPGAEPEVRPTRAPLPRRNRLTACAGVALCLTAVLAVQQYRAISDVYMPSDDSTPDEVRISRARQSWLFGHLGDRFGGTLAPNGQRTLEPYREVLFEMIDLNLLASWAAAYAENGDAARAGYLRARLAEFSPPPATQQASSCLRANGQAASIDDRCSSQDERLSYREFR